MKIKLVENIIWTMDKKDIEIFNKDLLIESTNGKLTCKGILKNVPVTKYTENENGRVYGRELWSNVKKSGKFENSLCMADHTDDGTPSVKNICGVWKKFNDNENIATADIYCVGKYGDLMIETAKNGGKIGFSTCGYGEFLEYNQKVVNPETYDYESTDWVISPSQGTYFSNQENIIAEQQIKENVNSSNLQESYTNNSKAIETKLDENIKLTENKKEGYMEKSILKNMVMNEIKVAKNNPKLLEAIQGLKEVDTNGDVELINKVADAVEQITAKLEESKTNTEKQLTEKVSKLDEMTVRYNKLAEGYKKMKAKAMELTEGTRLMKEDINCLVEDSSLRDNDIKCLAEDRKNMFADMKKLIEDRKNMRKDIKAMTAKLKEAEEVIGKQEDEMEKLGYEFEEEDEELDADGNPVVKAEEPVVAPAEEVKEEEMPAPEMLPVQPAEIKEEGDEQELPAPDTLAPMPAQMEEEDDEMLTLDFDDEDEMQMEEEDEMNAFELEPEKMPMEEPVMAEEEMPAPEMLPTEEPKMEEEEEEELDADGNPIVKPEEEMKEAEGEDEEEKEEEPKEDEKMEESKLVKFSWNNKPAAKASVKAKVASNSTLKTDLQKLVETQSKKVPAIKDIEKQIMASKSLMAAFELIQEFTKSKKDKVVKIAESASSTGLRKFKF